MKLSEAIRLGAMLKPQAFGYLFDEQTSCAQGAALEACGVTYIPGVASSYYHRKLYEEWPWADMPHNVCPEGDAMGRIYTPVATSIIAHLNNDHRWTRERIADWVQTIEPQEPCTPVRQEILKGASV